jgi:NADPH-dependent glutamate synthase beta subunit-like oxidoreductase/Pyruvate/2-oxoacid:ferredoxin oxidoreductase delta subunit
MSLLKKTKKKPFKATGRVTTVGEQSPYRPQAVEKLPPCIKACPSGNDIRGWLTIIAHREKLGLSLEEAYDRAWVLEMDTNPMPAVMGRVCPHPCESECNRKEKDGAVAINSVERSFGDWGIKRGLKPPTLDVGGPFSEKIAVVGSGPSGLSCAYQMARRGYKVTMFESLPKPGGMLRYGIPEYRMPRDVIDAEVQRILDLGVELRCGQTIGKEITFERLREEYDAVFIGIGAHQGRKLGVPGEDGSGVYTGTEFLRRANLGEAPPVGERVVVIGGGDTAIDAARVSLRLGHDAAAVSRRMGSQVTILYRRTRTEMPAIAREIEEALEEDIKIEFLAAPAKVVRDDSGQVCKMVVQKMELGEPDSSGRRRPVPIEGDLAEVECDTVITAVSQSPDTKSLGAFEETGWLEVDEWGQTGIEGVWSGGDNVTLGLATISIGQGRKAALSMHAALRGEEPRQDPHGPDIGPDRIKLDYYDPKPRAERSVLSPEERLANPTREIDSGVTDEQALEEVTRCFSCGSCFGCERCWMFCTPSCFKKISPPQLGDYLTINLDICNGCKKCAEECPCGFLDMV